MTNAAVNTFNSPLESGLRSVSLLVAAYPSAFDIQKLVLFDYLVVHTRDLGGPESLHPDLPNRSAELLVSRKLIESGLLLMMSRDLVRRNISNEGITYCAGDFSETFLNSLTSRYLTKLRQRAEWVIHAFSELDKESIKLKMKDYYDSWIEEFQTVQKSLGQ